MEGQKYISTTGKGFFLFSRRVKEKVKIEGRVAMTVNRDFVVVLYFFFETPSICTSSQR